MAQLYAVPEEGLKAVVAANEKWLADNWISRDFLKAFAREIIGAFILWQSEHPRVPTPGVTQEILKESYAKCDGSTSQFAYQCAEFQRRMYLAPEPEVPEEIKDLQRISLASLQSQEQLNYLVTALKVEAFRRGKAGN